MPIINRFKVDDLGLDVDGDTVANMEYEAEHDESRYDDFILWKPSITRSKITIHFKNGSKLELGPDVTATIIKTVELVEGRIYQVSRNSGQKWLALCKPDIDGEGLVLAPITYVTGAHGFSGDDKDKYQFHKEFDLDLKEYLK